MRDVGILVPDSKVHGTNMGPTWVLSAPDGTHIGPMNLAITGVSKNEAWLKAVQLAPRATGFAAIYFHEHMSRIEQQTCLMIIQGKHIIYICQHPLWMMTWANVGPASRPLYRRWSNLHHWHRNVLILMKFSSLTALEVVKITICSSTSDENFAKMEFSFQWLLSELHTD